MTRHKPHPRPKVLDVKRAKFEDGIERFIKKEPVKFFFWERPLSRTPFLDISGKVEKNRGYADTTPIMAISMRETMIIHNVFGYIMVHPTLRQTIISIMTPPPHSDIC